MVMPSTQLAAPMLKKIFLKWWQMKQHLHAADAICVLMETRERSRRNAGARLHPANGRNQLLAFLKLMDVSYRSANSLVACRH